MNDDVYPQESIIDVMIAAKKEEVERRTEDIDIAQKQIENLKKSRKAMFTQLDLDQTRMTDNISRLDKLINSRAADVGRINSHVRRLERRIRTDIDSLLDDAGFDMDEIEDGGVSSASRKNRDSLQINDEDDEDDDAQLVSEVRSFFQSAVDEQELRSNTERQSENQTRT